jgi:predicted ATPase/class 3 adenylate cyclase
MVGPSGTVTFLFTDIEGSTRLWERAPVAMQSALEAHDRMVKEAVESCGGYVFATGGDGFAAAFPRAGDALRAAAAAGQALEGYAWPAEATVRARMALHTGEAVERDGDYFGPAVNRTARLLAIAHGGQVVCSQSTASVVSGGDGLSSQWSLRSLGEHRLRDLSEPEQVFQVGEGSFPPLRSLDVRPTNLPVQRTSFVGRDRELKVALDAVEQSALVTLTGVGGVGKTRLALEVAGHPFPDLPDGAWLVELGAVAGADAVWEVTASALGVFPSAGQSARDAVLGYLGQRKLLLVIDNCEHLIDAVAALVDDVLASCPGVRVLTTSREALGIDGERIVPVPTLSLPGDDDDTSDALRLLIDRALTVRPGFSLTDHGRDALVEICRRVDGIPLAIELAAARLRAMTPEELAARLDQRFRLLVGSRRASVNRHQTLRSTIDWSYDLLDEAERSALQRVAVFAGGFDLDGAEALCDDIDADALDTLTRLADKSLVIADSVGASTRYRILETIRDYAMERLRNDQDVDAVRRRHAEYVARWSERAGAGLRGPAEREWVDAVDRELENLRTAVLWAVDAGDADLCVRLVAPLMLEIMTTDDTVGSLVELCLAVPRIEEHPLYAQLAAYSGYVMAWRGRRDEARALLAAADASVARRPVPAATLTRVLSSKSIATSVLDGFAEAMRVGHLRASAAREAGDDYELCRALGGIASQQGYLLDDARPLAEEAVALARPIGNPLLLSSSLFALANATLRWDQARALEYYHEAEVHVLASGNDRMALVIQGLHIQVLYEAGDLGGTANAVLRAVEFEWGRRHHLQLGYAPLLVLAAALAQAGHDEPASVLEGVYAAGPVAASPSMNETGRVVTILAALAEIPVRLGAERHQELNARGVAMDDAEIVEFVRSVAADVGAT